MSGWIERRRRAVGWAVFAAALAVLVPTLDDPGVTWDEPHYFGSAQLQVLWAKRLVTDPAGALDPATIREMWDWRHYTNPHPPIYKEGMALTWWAARGALGQLAAYRLWPALLFAGLVALLFRWGTAAWGGVAGLGAAAATFLQPRLFGHAHVAATDTPLAAFWVLGAAGVWWAVERDRGAGWVVSGIAWGLAAGTKFTGLAALVPALAWALWRDPRAALRGAPVAALVGVAAFAALNPLLWADPAGWTGQWVWESLHREQYAAFTTHYLGRTYAFDVPWHHPFVLTVAVLPLGIVALAAVGSAVGLGRRPVDPLALLAALSAAFVWALFLGPKAVHHDGVRQFLPVFPFLGLLAGRGLEEARRRLGGPGTWLVAGLAFAPPAAAIAAVHPHELAWYGEAVGGIAGARARGFETSYWYDAVDDDLVAWMNERLPHGAVVQTWWPPSLEMARPLKGLRQDLRFTPRPPADYILLVMRQSSFGPFERRVLAEEPLFAVARDGVVLAAVYRAP